MNSPSYNKLTIDLPDEFIELCISLEVTPETAIRQFIADAAGITSFVSNPRPDGYSSSGSDERELARSYLERTFR